MMDMHNPRGRDYFEKWGNAATEAVKSSRSLPQPTVKIAGKEVPFVKSRQKKPRRSQPEAPAEEPIYSGMVVRVAAKYVILTIGTPATGEIYVPCGLFIKSQFRLCKKGAIVRCKVGVAANHGRLQAISVKSVHLDRSN